MPDPLTHICTALLPKAITGGRHTGPFVVGAALPDVGSRLPGIGLDMLARVVPVPDGSGQPWQVFHVPLGAVTACALLALLFPEKERSVVFGWLVAGVTLHFATDVLQFHHGQGYLLAFPLWWRFELGWIGSEATVPWAPWLAAATGGAWAIRLGLRRRAPPPG